MGVVGAAAVAAVGTVAGSAISSSGAKSAAETQANAALNADQIQLSEFNTQQQNLAPYLAAGKTALANLTAGTQLGGAYNTPFTAAQFQNSAGYNFQKQQGDAAIQAQAAASGTHSSPATTEALINYNQGLANTDYNTAFNQYMATQGNALNEQQSLAGIGQTAVQQAGVAGTNYANQVSANTIGAGNAIAAGQVASANAFGSGLSGASNSLLNAYLYQSMFGGSNNNTAATSSSSSSAMPFTMPTEDI